VHLNPIRPKHRAGHVPGARKKLAKRFKCRRSCECWAITPHDGHGSVGHQPSGEYLLSSHGPAGAGRGPSQGLVGALKQVMLSGHLAVAVLVLRNPTRALVSNRATVHAAEVRTGLVSGLPTAGIPSAPLLRELVWASKATSMFLSQAREA
jgi:hypothetical protein